MYLDTCKVGRKDEEAGISPAESMRGDTPDFEAADDEESAAVLFLGRLVDTGGDE